MAVWKSGERVGIGGKVAGSIDIDGRVPVEVDGSENTVVWVHPDHLADLSMDPDDPRGALHDDWGS